jgi:hypothetical protein
MESPTKKKTIIVYFKTSKVFDPVDSTFHLKKFKILLIVRFYFYEHNKQNLLHAILNNPIKSQP